MPSRSASPTCSRPRGKPSHSLPPPSPGNMMIASMGISLNICDEKTCIISYNPDMPSPYPGLDDLTKAASVGTYTDLLSRDINALILDYLTMEGYPNAAAKFSKEANLQPHQSEQTIQARK